MALDFDMQGRRRFLRAMGLMLMVVSGSFTVGMGWFLFSKIQEGMSFFQAENYVIAFFTGGPLLYTIGSLVYRRARRI